MQLIASILDADGQGLSNSPAVTFRVKSGPGEFPTGRSITFDSKSDMSIQNGQCAIAFRSYYAGRTVIEAVSDGLKSDSVMLDFVGAPAYQPRLFLHRWKTDLMCDIPRPTGSCKLMARIVLLSPRLLLLTILLAWRQMAMPKLIGNRVMMITPLLGRWMWSARFC